MTFRARRQQRAKVEVNLTPLLDIVFNLLIFFLITTTFAQNPGIDVQLPKAGNVDAAKSEDNVVVAISDKGHIVHEGKAISRDELTQRLEEHQKTRPNAVIIIQADTNTPHGMVVDVMDLARSAGFSQLAIATEPQ